MELGYIRVSTVDQHTARQLADLDLPHENLFIDRCSGQNTDRPELKNLIRAARAGDTIHVHSLDRLGRNLKDLLEIIDTFVKKCCTVIIHKENLRFSSDKNDHMTRLILQIFGALAEWERAIIHERQAEGIKAAKAKGLHLGHPRSFTSEQYDQVVAAFKNDINTCIAQVSRDTKVPETTCRRIRNRVRDENLEVH